MLFILCPVRLTTRSQGVPVSAGSVEVYVNDEWGLVCDDGFDNADARKQQPHHQL